VTFQNGGATRLTTTKAYDNLNRLSAVNSQPSASGLMPIVYSYQYNGANQRTRATREDDSYWAYGYDPLGQVTSGKKYLADATAISGHQFGWTFDEIGNRRTAVVNGQTSSYTPNTLNQYSQRTVPGVVDVAGAANSQATVTVTFPAASDQVLPTARQGELFYKQLIVDNSSVAQYPQVKIIGAKNLVGPNGEDAVTEQTRAVLVAKTPEGFNYDADGNLTGDGKWGYTWDAENRLVAMETGTLAVTAGAPRQKLEFKYDFPGRRIQKTVFFWNLGLGSWNLETQTRFLYDGWNLLAELDDVSGNSVIRSYVWGLDLSGSVQGAGGVGGLLVANLGGAAHAVASDGNGNVIGLVDLASGARSAGYEYNAFGEIVEADGTASSINPFRFSTKYTDTEVGLVYYGLRYYCPATGRWLSRDPIAEQGGLNLYGFVAGNPVNAIDPLGQSLADLLGLGCCCIKGIEVKMDGVLMDGMKFKDYGTDFYGESSELGGYARRTPPPRRKYGYVGVAVQLIGTVDGDPSNCKGEQKYTELKLMTNGQVNLSYADGKALGTDVDDIKSHKNNQNPDFLKVVKGQPTFVDPGPAYPLGSDEVHYEVKLTSSFKSGGVGHKKCQFQKCSVVWYVVIDIFRDGRTAVGYWAEPMKCQ
jgi:RHS repeat-associated protein